MKNKHGVLMTLEELEEVAGLIEADNFDAVAEFKLRLNWYRATNIFLLTIALIVSIIWPLSLKILVILFVVYNAGHMVYVNYKLRNWKKEKIKEQRKWKTKRRGF
jgi:hypothetical protein